MVLVYIFYLLVVVLTVSSHSSLKPGRYLHDHYLEFFYLVDDLALYDLGHFQCFYPVIFFATNSSVFSLCWHVLSQSATSPGPQSSGLSRRHATVPSTIAYSGHQDQVLQECSAVGPVWPPVTAETQLLHAHCVGLAPLHGWLRSPAVALLGH